MVQSNHSVLGEGLRLYTNAMGRFIKQRLETDFRDNWWQEGVIKAFHYPRRHLENNEAKNRVELLAPNEFVDIIYRNRDLFRGAFPNRKETDSLLVQVSEACDRWANSLASSDLAEDDVVLTLMAMEKLLSDAGLSEVTEVRKLRRQVMRIPEPRPPKPVVSHDVKPESKIYNRKPESQPRVTLAEVVRQEVIDHWFTPARNRGEREVTVVSGDVHKRLGWQNRHPAVCGALTYGAETNFHSEPESS